MSSVLKNIETSQLIHMGVEVAVITGVGYWLNRKINNLQDKVDELTEQVNHHNDIISKQNEIILNHGNTINKLLTLVNQYQGGHADPPARQQSKPKKTTLKPIPEVQTDTVSYIEEDRVDDIIADELAELNTSEYCDLETGECDIKQEDKKK